MTFEMTSAETSQGLPGTKPRIDRKRETQEAIIDDAGLSPEASNIRSRGRAFAGTYPTRAALIALSEGTSLR